jgi:CARDB protein
MRVQVFAAALALVFTGSAVGFAAHAATAKPDLVVSSISNPPSVVFQGHSFQIRDRTRNRGRATAGRTVTQYYLRSDSSGAREPAGRRSVPRLRPAHSSSGIGTVTALSSLEIGTYSVIACADGGRAVSESSERDNCRTAATKVVIKKPPPPV